MDIEEYGVHIYIYIYTHTQTLYIYINTMKYHSAIEKDEVMPFAAT